VSFGHAAEPGHSSMARHYGTGSLAEARAYTKSLGLLKKA